MTRFRLHLWGTGFLFVSAGVLGAMWLWQVSPDQAKLWQFGVFYLLVFLTISSGATLLGYAFRELFWRRGYSSDFFRSARRQAALFGLLGVISLILLAGGLFSLKTAIPLIAIFTLIELYAQ